MTIKKGINKFKLNPQFERASKGYEHICNHCKKDSNIISTIYKNDIVILCSIFGSQNKLAKAIGTDQKTVSHWLKQDSVNVRYDMGKRLGKVAKALDEFYKYQYNLANYTK
jgi:UbiD family decarboxylase